MAHAARRRWSATARSPEDAHTGIPRIRDKDPASTVMHGECVLALAHVHRAQQLPALGIYARSDAHDKAVAYLEQAGDRAQGQHAHATAEGYYRPRRLRSLDHCKFAKARIP